MPFLLLDLQSKLAAQLNVPASDAAPSSSLSTPKAHKTDRQTDMGQAQAGNIYKLFSDS